MLLSVQDLKTYPRTGGKSTPRKSWGDISTPKGQTCWAWEP